ncbi:MAG: 2-oxoacid:acceptor oxidoreductase subunit alpha [Bacteroidota bacterium]
MSKKNGKVIEREDVVVKFAGDSGDGMQLTGSQFSDVSASLGNDLSTFPDFPSEIRAPQGTLAGVSGFQVRIGQKDIETPGDLADVLVAMNPAALKSNLKWVKPGATIIIDIDNFDNKHYKKAGFIEDPLGDGSLDGYNLIKAPISQLTRSTGKELNLDLDNKIIDKAKNQFVMGILFWLFNRNVEDGKKFLREKFKSKPKLVDLNIAVLCGGYHYAETIEALSTTFQVKPSQDKKGNYRQITGNIATSWGLIAGAEKAGLPLFLGSYPITPASEILQELSTRKSLGVKTFQAEDEIAGIMSAIGASFSGNLGATSTSGPGLSLKSEGLGLAVMTELPLVVVNVQRGGPSTGLPTKPEQADLLQAVYGRNGEAPMPVIASSSPGNCFNFAYEACRIALEHMTPVIMLSDGYLANGTELWKIPDMQNLANINPPKAKDNDPEFEPYRRDTEKLNRFWAVPGQKGLRHRVGGLEKADVTGEVSHDPYNHQKMVELRQEKVKRITKYIPKQEIYGNQDKGELLVVGWGGTYGALHSAVKDLRENGKDVSLAQFNYIYPLPENTEEVFSKFNKILVCELNMGQFAHYLRSHLPQFSYLQHNKVQGLPFYISELKNKCLEILED